MRWLQQNRIKYLYNVLDSVDLDTGVHTMNSCGIGILKPNIILIGFKNNWFNSPDEDVQTYLNTLKYKTIKLHIGGGLVPKNFSIFRPRVATNVYYLNIERSEKCIDITIMCFFHVCV